MPGRKRRPAFSAFLYRYRSLVERFFNKIKHFRAIATGYVKRDDNFLVSAQLASICIGVIMSRPLAYKISDGPARSHGAFDGHDRALGFDHFRHFGNNHDLADLFADLGLRNHTF
jgi:hypothetical protein